MNKTKLYILWAVSIVYTCAKYEIMDSDGRFDSGLVTLVVGFVMFLPILFFSFSAFLLLKRNMLFWRQLFTCIFLSAIGMRLAYVFAVDWYDGDPASNFIIEHALFLLLNIAAYIIFFRRRMNPPPPEDEPEI